MPLTLIVLLALAAKTLPTNAFDLTLTDDDRQAPLPAVAPCVSSYPYRTLDGSCNNLANPRFGQANTVFQRLMGPANYADGVSTIRLAESGQPLPSPRLISTTVTVNESVSESSAALVTMQWGQFVAHDVALPSATRTSSGAAISCCDGGRFGNVTANPDPECLHILIPSDDPVYKNANCLNVVRSRFGLFSNGSTPSSRQQLNTITHWLDGSQIYGSSDSVSQSLRDNSTGKGLLKVTQPNGLPLLPLTNACCTDANNSCSAAPSCFLAGDTRVRQNTMLTVLHTLWVREHNRVANNLFKLFGSSKSDEFYYQEARRIVIAEYQHITYNEFLPMLLGPLAKFKSSSATNIDPSLFNEFMAAAFRVGHSMARSFIRVYEADGARSSQSFFLGNSFNSVISRLLSPSFFDNALRGLIRNPAQSVDENFADDLTSQLLRTEGSALGGDLIATNLQRGRDHGMPQYVRARQLAQRKSGPLPTTFAELSTTTPKEVILYLQKVYKSVKDIDLYIGGVTEKRVTGALVGPTFGYIISKQFETLKNADRFFYSDTKKPVSFSAKKLKEIQKVSLARIICDNNDATITQIQPKAFQIPNESTNNLVACSKLPTIDFNQWK